MNTFLAPFRSLITTFAQGERAMFHYLIDHAQFFLFAAVLICAGWVLWLKIAGHEDMVERALRETGYYDKKPEHPPVLAFDGPHSDRPAFDIDEILRYGPQGEVDYLGTDGLIHYTSKKYLSLYPHYLDQQVITW